VGVSSAAPAALFTVYVEQERFEADYLWRLQPVNLAGTNDITTMPCLTVLWIHSFATVAVTGAPC
jgi:hypothetical protein